MHKSPTDAFPPSRSGRTRVWLWMSLLSLDAPLVALVWQDFLALCYPSVLQASGRCVLGLTVWAIYLVDRLIDVRHPAAERESTRHRFYRENRRLAKILLGAVLSADLFVALRWLRPAVFSNGLPVAAAVACYLTVFSLWRRRGAKWKQPCAAALFATGVFIIAWTGTADPWRVLAWPAAAFCALCFGNMLLVERWEQGRPAAVGWVGMTLLACGCALLGGSRWYAAVALSAAGLAVLHFLGRKLSGDARGVLADAVLFTPLLFLWR